MAVYVQHQAIPDLAEPLPFGGLIADTCIEPMRGPHNVLVILLDVDRPGHPAPSIAELDNAMF